MKLILALLIVVMLLVGVAAFTLPTIGAPLAPDQPLPLSIMDSGVDYVPHISCVGAPCDCQTC